MRHTRISVTHYDGGDALEAGRSSRGATRARELLGEGGVTGKVMLVPQQ
jgi:hypothetical protein